MAAPVAPAVAQLVGEVVTSAGFELFSLAGGGTRTRPLLEVRIDRPDGTKVTVDDCAAVSRAIEARLDGSGLVADTYRLEVSSPGMERPLRHAGDWNRFAGRRAAVTSGALVGSRVEGTLVGAESVDGRDVGIIRDDKGTDHRVALAEVKAAQLVVTWNRDS